MVSDEGQRGRSRWCSLALVVGLTVVAGLAAGCAEGDLADQEAEHQTSYCVQHPMRTERLLETPWDPMFEGNFETAKHFMTAFLDHAEEVAPAEIRGDVGVVVAAARAYEPGRDPYDYPGSIEAVEHIERWLREHCGPPSTAVTEATVPPATTHPGWTPPPDWPGDTAKRPSRPS